LPPMVEVPFLHTPSRHHVCHAGFHLLSLARATPFQTTWQHYLPGESAAAHDRHHIFGVRFITRPSSPLPTLIPGQVHYLPVLYSYRFSKATSFIRTQFTRFPPIQRRLSLVQETQFSVLFVVSTRHLSKNFLLSSSAGQTSSTSTFSLDAIAIGPKFPHPVHRNAVRISIGSSSTDPPPVRT